MLKYFLFFLIYTTYLSVYTQSVNDLDSLFIDRDIENYSIRMFTNFKVNKFSISNNNSKVRFVPNNRHGLGLGFANRKILIDVAFNIKNPNKDKTRRFDAQGTTIFKNRHYVNAYMQTYRGFSVKNNFEEPTVFKKDLHSVSLGFNYLYTFDDIEFSYSLLKAGLSDSGSKDMFVTMGLGVFSGFDYFSDKPSILSEEISSYFNAEANIKRYKAVTLGLLAGFISYIELPENIIATFSFMPGIGLVNKKMILQEGSYKPYKPMLYKLDFSVGLNYNFKQYYASLTYNNGLYVTDFGHGNDYRLSLTKAKLVIGYRFERNNRRRF